LQLTNTYFYDTGAEAALCSSTAQQLNENNSMAIQLSPSLRTGQSQLNDKNSNDNNLNDCSTPTGRSEEATIQEQRQYTLESGCRILDQENYHCNHSSSNDCHSQTANYLDFKFWENMHNNNNTTKCHRGRFSTVTTTKPSLKKMSRKSYRICHHPMLVASFILLALLSIRSPSYVEAAKIDAGSFNPLQHHQSSLLNRSKRDSSPEGMHCTIRA